VGGAGLGDVPVFRWDVNANTIDLIGGNVAGGVGISDDGLKIAANVGGKAAIYENNVWTALPPFPSCANGAASVYDISGDGSTVVGMRYGPGAVCDQLNLRAFKWSAVDGWVTINKIDAPTRMNRANAVNYDGSVIVGRDDANNGQLRGFQWRNGVYSLIRRNNFSVGEALDVSRDGQYIVGHSNSLATNAQPWLWSQSSGVQLLGATLGQDTGLGSVVCDDGSVITGHSLDFDSSVITPTIWTAGLGLTDFNQFLNAQGVFTAGLGMRLGLAMSSNCQTITGFSNAPIGFLGWVLKTPTSVVCHAPAESPTQLQTTIVSFPQGLDAALASGDTLGPCQCNVSAPTGIPQLLAAKPTAGNARLVWSAVGAAAGYDLVRGSLAVLKSSHGDFSAATTGCLENDLTATTRDDADTPSAGDGFWYLVRAINCGGSATFDSGAPSQVASRDAGIQASPVACP
jgi:probable HAF family extracellular repeat protein